MQMWKPVYLTYIVNVFVPADKAPNNVIIICKRYYIETLIKELGLDNCSTPTGNSTYTSCQMSSEDIVNTHDTFMKSLGIELFDDDKKLPYLYWTPKLHKSPVKHRFIAGSSKCTTKELSSLLTKVLTVIKTGLEKHCSIKTSHTGVNNMWILKNSTNLLSSLGHWESIEQLPFKHSIFLSCTLPSHIIYSSLVWTAS